MHIITQKNYCYFILVENPTDAIMHILNMHWLCNFIIIVVQQAGVRRPLMNQKTCKWKGAMDVINGSLTLNYRAVVLFENEPHYFLGKSTVFAA